MNIRKILERFLVMANISQNDGAQWLPLCTETFEEIKSSLKECVDESKHETRLNNAAACLAFYRYTLYRFSRRVSSPAISAMSDSQIFADTSQRNAINRTSAIYASAKAWEEIRASLSDILKDPEFIFKGVK